MSTPSPAPAKPFAIIRAFLAAKQRILSSLRDEGGLFECRFLRRQVDKAHDQVLIAGRTAGTIRDRMSRSRQWLIRHLGPADRTPGILDAEEAAEFQREFGDIGNLTTRHATHLDRIV